MGWLDKFFRRKSKPAAKARTDNTDNQSKAIAAIDDYASRDIATGFRTEEQVVENVCNVLGDDFEGVEIGPLAEERTRLLMERRRQEEASWPSVTDCDRLDRAFEDLESRGIVCRQDFSCCGTCGAGEIRTEMEEVREKGSYVQGYAFYHVQDTEGAVEDGALYLSYGSTDEGETAALRVGHAICDAIRAQGLLVRWDGTWATRIRVQLDWKRRIGPRCSLS